LTTQELERIDQYLNGTLTEAEHEAFEQQLAQDTTLASSVAEMRAANEAIYYGSLAELKQTIGQDVKNIQYKPNQGWKTTRTLSIASLIVVSGITAYLINDQTTNGTSQRQSDTVVQNAQSSGVAEHVSSNAGSPAQPKTIHSSGQTNTETPDHASVNKTAQESIVTDPHTQQQNQETTHTNGEQKTGIATDSAKTKTLPQHSTEVKTVCDKTFTINTLPSCKHSETGSITIQSDETVSYLYQVDDHRSARGLFQQLAAGEHQILITYNKTCSYTKKIRVAEKWCGMNESFSFNPEYNEKWSLKYEDGASGTFSIFDRTGKQIYTAPFGSGNEQWNGTDMYGTVVAVGVYIADIRYADGRQEKVNITIVR